MCTNSSTFTVVLNSVLKLTVLFPHTVHKALYPNVEEGGEESVRTHQLVGHKANFNCGFVTHEQWGMAWGG